MRVLLPEINQETNTFCATPAVLEDYKRTLFAEGEELYQRVRGKELCLGGMIDALEEDGIEVIPDFGIRATAGGVSASEVYDEVEKRFRRIAAECGKIDGCYISFHGSHQSVDSDDVCGDALVLARELFGKDIVIACSNDLHGDITKKCSTMPISSPPTRHIPVWTTTIPATVLPSWPIACCAMKSCTWPMAERL